MFPRFFRSREPVVVERPQRDSGSTATTVYTGTRSSTGSSTSIADVEAGFLRGHSNPQEQWKSTRILKSFLAKLGRSSGDEESDRLEKPRKRLTWTAGVCIVLSILLLGVTAALLVLEIPRHSPAHENGVELIVSRWGLPNPTVQRELATWPTAFSRDIKPIACHSHNDYWRRVPLYDALAAGCTGVEADVWLDPNHPNDLFVGHTRKSLTSARTLKSLYIDPLLTILNNQNNNPSSSSSPSSPNDTTTTFLNSKIGIFDVSPTTSLTLLIDLKTDPLTTFPLVIAAIKPLLDAGYLTTYSASTSALVRGPITVVATGNTNFEQNILSPANTSPLRTIFFDAPLPALSTTNPSAQDRLYDSSNSYYASASFDKEIGKPFFGRMMPDQVWKVRRQVEGARRRGLVSRYWDTPGGTRAARRGVWEVLVREGVGVLSVDDLEGVREFLGG
ncbi:MAG: hypothetical protein Q9184_004910 [Pyrenodesmia sp. 2 TL-2023]